MGYTLPATERVIKIIKNLKECSDYSYDMQILIEKRPPKIKIDFLDPDKKYDSCVCGFTLIEQINCCGIIVSTKTYVNENYRGNGLAQQMMPLKESIAKEFGYSLLMATVNITGNPAEVHILEKFGWELRHSFKNSRTKNEVGIYTKDLK